MKFHQSKLFNKITAEIILEKGIIKFQHKKLLNFHSNEIPLNHINPEEVQSSKINFSHFFISLGLIAIGCIWIFDCIAHLKLLGNSNLMETISQNSLALIVGLIGGGMIGAGAINFCYAISSSGRTAYYKKYTDNQKCIYFYCSKNYLTSYLEFKKKFLDAVHKEQSKSAFNELISKCDTDSLLNIFPMIVIQEMKNRGIDVKKYLEFLIAEIDTKTNGKVVTFTPK